MALETVKYCRSGKHVIDANNVVRIGPYDYCKACRRAAARRASAKYYARHHPGSKTMQNLAAAAVRAATTFEGMPTTEESNS